MKAKKMSRLLSLFLVLSLLPIIRCAPKPGSNKRQMEVELDDLSIHVETPLEERCEDLTQFPAVESLVPDVVTDGDAVCIYGDFPGESNRVVLRGYKYTQPPLLNTQGGELDEGVRECIYCGCIAAVIVTGSDDVKGLGERVCFHVPKEAPSGEYEVTVLPSGNECPAGGPVIPSEEQCPNEPLTCPSDSCQSFPLKLHVLPAYIVSIWDKLDVRSDSEPESCNWRPAELSFTFGAYSGNPMTETNFPVEFSGAFPAPSAGSGHLTALDGTSHRPRVPAFVGRQDQIEFKECLEESVSKRNPELEVKVCEAALTSDQYSGDFTIGLGGIEDDPGDTPWYAVAGGIGAAALGCYASYRYTGGWKEEAGCAGAIGAGAAIKEQIKEWSHTEDDKIGAAELTVNEVGDWGVDTTETRKLEGGEKEKGDMTVSFVTDRVGGAPILWYRVQLESVNLLEGYEFCFDATNELFLQARAVLVTDSATALNPPTPKRFPEDGHVNITPSGDGTFPEWPVNWTVAWESFDPPQRSPVLYIEFSLWEDDGDDNETDLIGIYSETFFISHLAGTDVVISDAGPFQGRAARRTAFSKTATVEGWANSDCADCSGFWAKGWDCSGKAGRASIQYRIEFTWLKHAL